MLKEVTFDHPDKMHFESAHKTFNQQTNLIGAGNVLAPTQYSSYIRPYTETEQYSEEAKKPGHLQNYDLEGFKRRNVPDHVLREVRLNTHDEAGILYLFFHRNGQQVMLDGVVLTYDDYHHIQTWYLNPDWRARDAVEKASEYVALPPREIEPSRGIAIKSVE